MYDLPFPRWSQLDGIANRTDYYSRQRDTMVLMRIMPRMTAK